MTNHTATPWSAHKYKEEKRYHTIPEPLHGFISAPDGLHCIARLSRYENAVFIVKAANHHDELLEALNQAHQAIDILFAKLIVLTHHTDQPFYPTKSGQPWEAAEMITKILTRLEESK